MTTWWGYVERVAGDATQVEIAEHVGIDQATVSRWKNGEKPKFETVKQFARSYGRNQLQALVAAGYLDADVVTTVTVPRPASDLPTKELIEEAKEFIDEFNRRYQELEKFRERKRHDLRNQPAAPPA